MHIGESLPVRILYYIIAIMVLPVARLEAQAVAEGKVQLRKAGVPEIVNQRYMKNLDASVIASDPPRAVVYLEGPFPPPATQPQARMGQKDLAFENSLLPVQVGTLVSFPNEDDVYHNIFSFSKPKRFDLGRYRKDETPVPTVVFDKVGPVSLHCDIHEHMHAVILVLDTPYFVRTDLDGNYKLPGLPPGHYVLKAWVDSKTTYERPVDLTAAGKVHADFP
jgi:plastocyanin